LGVNGEKTVHREWKTANEDKNGGLEKKPALGWGGKSLQQREEKKETGEQKYGNEMTIILGQKKGRGPTAGKTIKRIITIFCTREEGVGCSVGERGTFDTIEGSADSAARFASIARDGGFPHSKGRQAERYSRKSETGKSSNIIPKGGRLIAGKEEIGKPSDISAQDQKNRRMRETYWGGKRSRPRSRDPCAVSKRGRFDARGRGRVK